MTIGERIRLLRAIVGTTKQNIYKYENNIVTNIPSDRIEIIAKYFHVSPAYLMGWETNDDKYSLSFRKMLEIELSLRPRADLDRFNALINRDMPITLSEACSVAEALGVSLDYLVGLQKSDAQSDEFFGMFSKLSGDQKKMLIMQLKGLLTNE